MSNTVHAVGGIFTEGVVEATTQARCNKKMVQSGMTVSSNWEEVTCGRCLKMYVRHDGRKNSPLPVLEYVREELVGNGRTSEEMTEARESLLHKGDRQYASPEQVTSLDQLEVGTVVEQKFYDWGKSTHWVITAIKAPPMSSGNIAVYANRVRKSDHKVIIRGSNGLPTYNTVIAWFITGELKKDAFTLTVIESKQVVEQPEEEERLSICCGADEDENIENMCSACHESTTFEVPHRNLDGSLGEMPPEPETPKTPTFKEAMTVAHEKIQKELTKVKIELETESEDANGSMKKAFEWPATERRLLEKKHTLEGKMYGLIYAESTFTLTQPKEIPETPLLDDNFLPIPEPEIDHSIAPSPVKFETVVHSNMNQLISELSGAVAYLEDMNISNNKHPYDIQSQGLYKAIRNAKNIASALRQDAIDRKEINVA